MAMTADSMLLGADLALTTPAAKQPMDVNQFRSANWRYLPDQSSNYGSNIMWTLKDLVGTVKDLSTAYLDIPLSIKSSQSGTPYTASLAPAFKGWYLSIIDRITVKSNQSGVTFVDGQANDTFLGAWALNQQNMDVESYRVDAPEIGFALDDAAGLGITKRAGYFAQDFQFDTASASFVGRMRIPLRYLDSFFATQALSFGISLDLTVYHNLSNTAQSCPFYAPTGTPAPIVSIGTAVGASGVQSPGQCYLCFRAVELNVEQAQAWNQSLSVPRVQRYLTMRAYTALLNQTGTQINANITTTLSRPNTLYVFAVPSGAITSPLTTAPFAISAKLYNIQVSINNARLFEQPLGQALAPGANGGNSYRDYEIFRELKDAGQWSSMKATGLLDFANWNSVVRVVSLPLFRQQINRNVESNQSLDISFNVVMPAGVTSMDYYWVVSKERTATYSYSSGAVSVNVSQ